MAARGHYRRVSNVDRGRLIETFEDNHADYLELADTLSRGLLQGPSWQHTGAPVVTRSCLQEGHTTIDEEMRDELERLLDVNPLLTLTQMKDELQRSLPDKPAVSPSTIARTMDGMLMTLKLAEDVPDARNSPRILDMRVEYAQWFMQYGVVGHCVFIDETGYNIMDEAVFWKSTSRYPSETRGTRTTRKQLQCDIRCFWRDWSCTPSNSFWDRHERKIWRVSGWHSSWVRKYVPRRWTSLSCARQC